MKNALIGLALALTTTAHADNALHTTWTAQTTDFDGNNSYTNVGPATGQIPIAGNTWHCFYGSPAVSTTDGSIMRKLECGDGTGIVGTLASCDPHTRSSDKTRLALKKQGESRFVGVSLACKTE